VGFVPRSEVIGAKFAASAQIAGAFVVPATAFSGLIALQGVSGEGIATSRALLFGLAYVFIWEGLVTELFSDTRHLSIRQYCLGIADFIATVREQDFEANLGGPEGLILATVATAAALVLAVRRLEAFELTDMD